VWVPQVPVVVCTELGDGGRQLQLSRRDILHRNCKTCWLPQCERVAAVLQVVCVCRCLSLLIDITDHDSMSRVCQIGWMIGSLLYKLEG
jgi:hypothetical protein